METNTVPSLFELCFTKLFKKACPSEINNVINQNFTELPENLLAIAYSKFKPKLSYLDEITESKMILCCFCFTGSQYNEDLMLVWNDVTTKLKNSSVDCILFECPTVVRISVIQIGLMQLSPTQLSHGFYESKFSMKSYRKNNPLFGNNYYTHQIKDKDYMVDDNDKITYMTFETTGKKTGIKYQVFSSQSQTFNILSKPVIIIITPTKCVGYTGWNFDGIYDFVKKETS